MIEESTKFRLLLSLVHAISIISVAALFAAPCFLIATNSSRADDQQTWVCNSEHVDPLSLKPMSLRKETEKFTVTSSKVIGVLFLENIREGDAIYKITEMIYGDKFNKEKMTITNEYTIIYDTNEHLIISGYSVNFMDVIINKENGRFKKSEMSLDDATAATLIGRCILGSRL